MPRRKTNRKMGGRVKQGAGFFDDFVKGFKMPFSAVGKLASSAVEGLLGDGRKPNIKGGAGNMMIHRAEDRMMRPTRNGHGYNGEDYISKYRHVNSFPANFHREYVAKYQPYANSPAIGLVRY